MLTVTLILTLKANLLILNPNPLIQYLCCSWTAQQLTSRSLQNEFITVCIFSSTVSGSGTQCIIHTVFSTCSVPRNGHSWVVVMLNRLWSFPEYNEFGRRKSLSRSQTIILVSFPLNEVDRAPSCQYKYSPGFQFTSEIASVLAEFWLDISATRSSNSWSAGVVHHWVAERTTY